MRNFNASQKRASECGAGLGKREILERASLSEIDEDQTIRGEEKEYEERHRAKMTASSRGSRAAVSLIRMYSIDCD